MAAQQPVSMPKFVARCLEEIGLEGRCGIPLRDMFVLVDPVDDAAYRRYAWRVLRSMRGYVRFHRMERTAVAIVVAPTAQQQQRSGQYPLVDSRAGAGRVLDPQAARRTSQQQQLQPAPPTARDQQDDQQDDPHSPTSSPPRRKRKWSTTLMASPSASADEAEKEQWAAEQLQRMESRSSKTSSNKKSKHKLEPVVPSARRKAQKKQLRSLADAEKASRKSRQSVIKKEPVESTNGVVVDNEVDSRCELEDGGNGYDVEMLEVVDIANETAQVPEERLPEQEGHGGEQSVDTSTSITAPPRGTAAILSQARSSEVVQGPESVEWIYRSPRGYTLGEELDASTWSYEGAMATQLPDTNGNGSSSNSVLGVVVCEPLRLKYLGVTDPAAIDTMSPQFDLLEMIGRAREQGENAAMLTNSNIFGDSRKLHYLLDMLIASNYIEKNMVTADHRRFNILHLTRFVSKFHPSMVSPSATMERTAFPKEFIAYVIAEMLVTRGERTCVFADIGRELGYDKRYQEKLRKYFFHQMHVQRDFPLELFMARCNTGSSEYRGRKLWCIRLRHALAATRGVAQDSSVGRFEPIDPPAVATTGPVIERGIMEQVYMCIDNRKEAGATIPEIRDMLGVPTFKLPYKLAQGLISKYNLIVEHVVVGKSTMYRMFIPGANPSAILKEAEEARRQAESGADNGVEYEPDEGDETAAASTGNPQPSTMKAASRGVLIASTSERRRNYMLERIQREKIVAVYQLRTGLMHLERDPELGGSELGIIDIRSVRRILDELEASKLVVTIDITLPPKRVLQKSERVIKCVCVPGYQRDRDAITAFVDAYVEEQQQRFLSDIGQPENVDVIVVSDRGRGRKKAVPVQSDKKEVVTYAAVSYKTARVNMAKLSKQSRRLGMIFGSLYRCRAMHLLLWEKISSLRHKAMSLRAAEDKQEASSIDVSENEACPKAAGDVVFALHEVLELLSVKEYLHFAGVNELLTETEENKVRMAMARGDSWEILSSEIQQKIRGCEVDRFSRIMRILIELGLVQVANDSSSGLLNVFRSDDFDAMVSQVAFATLSGGLFRIKERVRIAVKRGDKVLKQLPTKQSYVYAASFSAKSRSDHFAGKVPLEFMMKDAEGAKEYWKALRFLSLEDARLGSGIADGESMSVNLDSELIRPVPLKDHNIYSLRVWMPSGMANPARSSAKSKAAEAVAEPMMILKRKRFQNAKESGNTVEGAGHKKAKTTTTAADVSSKRRINGSRIIPSTGDTAAGVSKFRRLVSNKQSVRASKWTLEDDMKLMDAYIDELSCKWFIEIPLALQKGDERLAFRNTSLDRSRISWKNLAKALGKRFFDCYLRVNELLNAPAVRARVVNTKLSITQMKNPGGLFHEELAVAKDPRLAALLNRALQILFHERASYYPVLADLLISQWSEAEVKLVWRYLWLAGLITRTRKPNDSDQKERGFAIHSRVYEMKSLDIAHYPMEVFCEAAEYASFVQENVKEAAMLESGEVGGNGNGEDDDGDGENECYFEHELEQNAGAGQTAVELSSMILSVSELIPEYVPRSPDRRAVPDAEEAKRGIVVKGFAGHLATCTDGAEPDDFLKEYWTVKSRVQVALLDESKQEVTLSERAKSVEAFSTCPALQEELEDDDVAGDGSEDYKLIVSSLVFGALQEVAANGLSFDELCDRVHTTVVASQPSSDSISRSARIQARFIRHELDGLVSEGRVIEVNGYAQVRFVLKEHGELWTLHPYRVIASTSPCSTSSSTNTNSQPPPSHEKLQFRFDKQQTIVARPWFLLDGTRNTRIELMIKRKVVNIVMCNPGIQDRALHRKMRQVLSLQNLRCLVDELISDEILYARLVRGVAQRPTSIFKAKVKSTGSIWKRPRSDDHALVAIAPGELRFVDMRRDEVHYFPAVNCIELLGAAACDADVRSN
ncbi:B-block binding subunit of tfiiic [Globisporangium polare]